MCALPQTHYDQDRSTKNTSFIKSYPTFLSGRAISFYGCNRCDYGARVTDTALDTKEELESTKSVGVVTVNLYA
jgi:hypothetical protein